MKLFFTSLLVSITWLAGAQVILDEKFENNANNWQLGKTANTEAKIIEGRDMYMLKYKLMDTHDAFTSWTDLEIDEKKDFRIEALFYKQSGVKNYGYGILWGGAPNNFYSFLISGTGYFCVGKAVDGKWNDISTEGWIHCPPVKEGRHKFNKLKIEKKGSTSYFYVNDTMVGKYNVGKFFGNKIGFNVNKRQKVLVDWIKVEYI